MDTNGKKILLVDDERDLVILFSCILKLEGYIVDSFTDSSEALLNYKTNYYDLVLLDVKMPNIDGLDLYKKIKEIDPSVYIYFLTASELYYEGLRKEEYEKINPNLFIRKPIDNDELVKRIKTILL